ncbi:MAG: CARDB domain-containing protein [Halobacteriota archaeon]
MKKMSKQFTLTIVATVAIVAIMLFSVQTAMAIMPKQDDVPIPKLPETIKQIPLTSVKTPNFVLPIVTIPVCKELQMHLDCVTTKKADIVFVFDTTGSMGGEISEMKNITKDFADGLAAAGIDYRFGLTEFRDFPVTCDGTVCGDANDFAYKVYDGGVLSDSSSMFKSWIDSLNPSGGGDLPESTLAALMHTVKDQKWRDGDASKIIVLISDAYPHSDGHCCNQEKNTFDGVISALTRSGMTVYVVGPDEASMEMIANSTGGKFFQIRAEGVSLKPVLEEIAGVLTCSFDIVGDGACEGNRLELCVQLLGADNLPLPHHSGYTEAWMFVRCPDGSNTRYDLNYDTGADAYCAVIDPVCGGSPEVVDVTVYGKVCEWRAAKKFEFSCGAQKIFFSTEEDFVTQGPEPPDGNPIISDGDLLCSDCTVFARNRELLAAFQTQFDLGLDAADVIDAEARKPLVAFSTELNDPQRRFSAGDLLATNGAVIPNIALLASFDISKTDLGLDAVHFIGDKERIVAFLDYVAEKGMAFWNENPNALPGLLKERNIDIWFSTEGTAPKPEDPGFLDGDLLSARDGVIIARNAILLPSSVPAGIPDRSVDFGLDAVIADRSGNRDVIRLSTEILYAEKPGFTDGDVILIGNGVVCTNEDLIRCFEPKGNFLGLDALAVVVEEACEPSIEVDKQVWDTNRQAWVEETTAHIGDTVTFQSTIHNDGTCCSLYNIAVTDVLPECLDYAGNVQTNIKQNEPEVTNNKELKWFFEGPLNPCETITISYKARVVNCGKNENVQRVEAVCEKTGVEVFAEDRAIVIVPCEDVGEKEKPDLVITQITGIGVVGEPLNIYYTIKNRGNAAAGPSHTGLYINGNFIKEDYVSALAPGASIIAKSFDYIWDCKKGEQAEIKVCADIATQVDESDETNNCKAEVWTCTVREPEVEKPDLVITQITGIGVVGEPLNIYYTMKNQGNAASGPSHTGLYINGNFIKKVYVSALAPGASVIAKSFDYTWDCKKGEQAQIKVCADIATQVDESDEGNNCKADVWTCTVREPEKPDLVITRVWHEWDRKTQNTIIKYSIKNQGKGTAGASKTYMSWYSTGKVISTDAVPSLSAGQTRTESFAPYPFSSQGFDINVCADGDHKIAETNEKNNCKRYTMIG